MTKIFGDLNKIGLVPMATLERAEDAPKLGQALLKSGLPCLEITFRTAVAQEAIRLLTTECPEMVVGAGTVLSVEQVEQAISAGAKFIVTPGFDDEVVDWCLQNDIPITPGVATPTEVNRALKKGLRLLKFFPAEASGGVKMLKAMAGPFQEVKFIPTGGINATNLPAYLILPSVHACGGSWMVKKQFIAKGEFDKISALACEAVAIVHRVRETGG